MYLDVLVEPRTFTLYGFSKVHDADKAYGTEMFELMDKLWAQVREKQLSHLGSNHVVYDCGDILFVGVELRGEPESDLERKQITFEKCVYCKHIGPWRELGNVYDKIQDELKQKGLKSRCPSLEIYGHGTDDESKQETEIFITIE